MDIDKIKGIENRIGYSFINKDKLAQAFTTKSFAKEETDHGRPCESQEEYRTRGDAILKQVLIEILSINGYKTPQQITDAKSELENKVKLSDIFSSFKIPPDYFQKRKGEPVSIPLRAETFESLICAMFLDISSKSGEEIANKEIRNYILTWFKPYVVPLL